MDNLNTKKWTILIYADGNNEMEDVMCKSFSACEKIGSNDKVNVVIQIGKLGYYNGDYKRNWAGVRRYYVENGHSTLINDLGKTNMADPNVLYDFIKWGYENYAAEHFMLILSDHGGDFIGCFTDLSLDVPYIMGIPEMIQAINAINKNLGYIIDILVLDMCYMNCVEVLYEVGQREISTIKTLITYMDYAAYEGLCYDTLIANTQLYSNFNDMNLFIKNLINSQDFNLIAYEINHRKLELIKSLFNELAKNSSNSLDTILNSPRNKLESNLIENINNNLNTLVKYSKSNFNGINSSINISNEELGRLIVFYEKLAFSKNNFWTKLLNKTNINKNSVEKGKVNVSLINSPETKIHYLLKFK